MTVISEGEIMAISAHRRQRLTLILGTLALGFGSATWASRDPAPSIITASDYARAESFVLDNQKKLVANAAVRPTWIGSGDQFWYLREAGDRKEFVVFDAGTLDRAPAFDHEKLAAMLAAATGEEVDPAALPFTHFDFNRGRSSIRVTVGGEDWSCSFPEGACQLVPPTAPPDQLVSPDGTMALLIQDHDLWIRELDGSGRRALTTDGEAYYEYGKSPDMNTFTVTLRRMSVPLPPLALWSPDSKKVLVGRLDERRVKELHLLQSAPEDGSARPRLHTYRYAMPGDEEIPEIELFIIDVDSGKQIAVKRPPMPATYMSVFEEQLIWWNGDGSRAYCIEKGRGDTSLTLLEIDPKNGSVRELITETGDTYVEPGLSLGSKPVVRVLGSGERIVWFSERDGWGHLYLYDGHSGKLLNRITGGEFVVRDILRVDEDSGQIFFLACGREGGDPYYTSLYRVNLDGSDLKLLTPEPAQHDIVVRSVGVIAQIVALIFPTPSPMAEGFSPSGRYFVDTYSRANRPPVSVLRSSEGELLATLETADTTALSEVTDRPLPEPFTVKARDGSTDIYGLLYRPHDFDPDGRYPVIDAIYGGPQALRTPKSFAAALADDASGLAELGFVVVTVDGLGTPYRSKAFHDASVGHLEEAGGIEDHIAALRQLAERFPWMDLDRVGIFGHSGGGFASTRAILAYPDFFKVAVSSAGNHDQRGYLSEWGERYLGPLGTAEDGTTNYDSQINARLAANLKGKLLLMHGDMDDNVHPALTLQVVDSLIKANRDFDFLIIPNANHMSAGSPYFIRRRWDYFVEHLLGAAPPAGYRLGAPKVSEFGRYEGYSHVAYEEFRRTSVYVSAQDGTRLAVDVYRPSRGGVPASQPLPAVLSLTRYYRSYLLPDDSIRTIVGTLEPGNPVGAATSESPRPALELLRHGYVVVSADVRGTGASFGSGVGTEAFDASAIIAWIADQPWCDGKVGMVGRSYLGTVQLMAAAAAPPALKAIFPGVPSFFDGHRILYGGGVMRKGGVVTMRNTLAALADADEEDARSNPRFGAVDVPPVDEDPDGVLKAEARAGHGQGSFDFYLALWRADPNIQAVIESLGLSSEAEIIDALISSKGLAATLEAHPEIEAQLVKAQFYRQPFTDMLPSGAGDDVDGTGAVKAILDLITASGIPAYFWDGWRDPLPHDRALFYANIDVPKRIVYGPWTHGYNEPDDPREEASASLEAIEQLRWFDYWLKGVDNGIVDEPPVTYAVMDTRQEWTWRTADSLPIPDTVKVEYFFGAGRTGSVDSVNDGLLGRFAPASADGADGYTVDYSATSGTTTRLHDTTGGGPEFYPDMTANDAKGLTYTTGVLDRDLVIAGYPIVTLFVSADVPDHELTVYLEEVEADGYSRYLTQNSLMASHRTLGSPKFSNLGLPWATSTRRDVAGVAPLTDGVAEVTIVLEPVANLFNAGHRIRVTVTGADADLNWSVPRTPPARLTVHRSSGHPSRIVLPVLATDGEE